MIELSIIILSYNTKGLTLRCIESIIKQYKKELEEKRIEIIVVDNASSDASASAIYNFLHSTSSGQEFTINNLKLIKNKQNFGFAKGCNIGAKESLGRYILFLNSDAQVLDDGFLRMAKFLDKHLEVGILGGKLLNPDGSAQASVGKFYNIQNLFLMLVGIERFGVLRTSPRIIKQVDWVSGACMMVRRNIFEKLKGFDEFFFMYVEDMELCFRARKLSFLTYFYPNVSLMHRELGSSNKTFAVTHIYKGILYFYKKHSGYLGYSLVRFLLIFKAWVAILIGFLVDNNYLKNTYRQAIKF